MWKKMGIVLLIAGVIGSIWLWQISSKQSGYIFGTVEKTDLTEIVSDSGKIISDGKIDITSPTNGIITQLFVENGQKVKEDDELFEVKSSATPQEQQNAYAAYQTAIVAQNNAQTQLLILRAQMFTAWKTFTDLATNPTYEQSKGVPNEENRRSAEFQSTRDTWLAAEKRFKDQEQAVSAAAAQVNTTWNAYVITQTPIVTSPIEGTVTNLSVSEGKSVTTTSLTTPATVVLTIVTSPHVEALRYE